MAVTRRGRPATGRTTKVVRVPAELDVDLMLEICLEWVPIIREYASTTKDSPRYDKLNALLVELGLRSPRGGGS